MEFCERVGAGREVGCWCGEVDRGTGGVEAGDVVLGRVVRAWCGGGEGRSGGSGWRVEGGNALFQGDGGRGEGCLGLGGGISLKRLYGGGESLASS